MSAPTEALERARRRYAAQLASLREWRQLLLEAAHDAHRDPGEYAAQLDAEGRTLDLLTFGGPEDPEESLAWFDRMIRHRISARAVVTLSDDALVTALALRLPIGAPSGDHYERAAQ